MTPMQTVAVSGADGFLGAHLCDFFEREGRHVVRVVRRLGDSHGTRRVVPDLSCIEKLTEAFSGVDAVVHLAARAHVIREREESPIAVFRKVNVEGTRSVCEAAVRSGVKRLLFVSSIGVNGHKTESHPFTEADAPNPCEPYAQSKLEAEGVVRRYRCDFGLHSVVVRPSLVYGPGVKGNFLRLLKLAYSGLPLPLAAVENRRNLIGVQNLCHLLSLCLDSQSADGETFLAAEPTAHSTAEIFRCVYASWGRSSRLFSVPERVLRVGAKLLGFESLFDKLCGSLEVCSEKARRELGWVPQVSFEEEIARTAEWFLNTYCVK